MTTHTGHTPSTRAHDFTDSCTDEEAALNKSAVELNTPITTQLPKEQPQLHLRLPNERTSMHFTRALTQLRTNKHNDNYPSHSHPTQIRQSQSYMQKHGFSVEADLTLSLHPPPSHNFYLINTQGPVPTAGTSQATHGRRASLVLASAQTTRCMATHRHIRCAI